MTFSVRNRILLPLTDQKKRRGILFSFLRHHGQSFDYCLRVGGGDRDRESNKDINRDKNRFFTMKTTKVEKRSNCTYRSVQNTYLRQVIDNHFTVDRSCLATLCLKRSQLRPISSISQRGANARVDSDEVSTSIWQGEKEEDVDWQEEEEGEGEEREQEEDEQDREIDKSFYTDDQFYVWKNIPYIGNQHGKGEENENEIHPKNCLDIYISNSAGLGFPRPLQPVLIFVHGGAWVRGDKEHPLFRNLYGSVAKSLAFPYPFLDLSGKINGKYDERDHNRMETVADKIREGMVVVLINYRLSPEVSHPFHLLDVVRSIDFLTRIPEKEKKEKEYYDHKSKNNDNVIEEKGHDKTFSLHANESTYSSRNQTRLLRKSRQQKQRQKFKSKKEKEKIRKQHGRANNDNKSVIESYGGDPRRVFLMGHSAGAHLLALYLLQVSSSKVINVEGDGSDSDYIHDNNSSSDLHIWKEIERLSESTLPQIKGFISLSGVFDLLQLESNPLGSYHLSSQNIFQKKQNVIEEKQDQRRQQKQKQQKKEKQLQQETSQIQQIQQNPRQQQQEEQQPLIDASPIHILQQQTESYLGTNKNSLNRPSYLCQVNYKPKYRSRLMDIPSIFLNSAHDFHLKEDAQRMVKLLKKVETVERDVKRGPLQFEDKKGVELELNTKPKSNSKSVHKKKLLGLNQKKKFEHFINPDAKSNHFSIIAEFGSIYKYKLTKKRDDLKTKAIFSKYKYDQTTEKVMNFLSKWK